MSDLISTGGSGAPAARRNLDSFAPTVSGGEGGFRDPSLRERVPWFAAAADDNAGIFDSDTQLFRRDGWLLESEATNEQINNALDAAPFRDSSLHVGS